MLLEAAWLLGAIGIMSEVEIAGLVLGIFPLIIERLKIYINEKNTANDLF